MEVDQALGSVESDLHICHFISYLGSAQGGPVVSMAALAEGALGKGCRVTVASMPRETDGSPLPFPSQISQELECDSLAGSFRWAPNLVNRLAGKGISLVHSHGLWTYASLAAAQLSKRTSTPHLLAPCGMLQAGAMQHSRLKKKIAAFLFQDKVFRQAQCLHAKSDAEFQSIRDYGLLNPVAIVPNPVQSAPGISGADVAAFRKRHDLPEREKQVLFLGRVHPVKGLDRMLQAWAALGTKREGWGLVISGPDEGGYQRVLEKQIQNLSIMPKPRFTGSLHNQEKWVAFKASHIFVMPSDFENFGSAIAEAMTAGLPVITTKGTPWKVLAEQGCGWYVDADPQALKAALSTALETRDEELQSMGQAGSRLAKDWCGERVTDMILEVYRWLVGQGPKPDCVVLD